MTIRQLLNLAGKKIKSTSANLDAEVLLAFVLKKTREYLFTNYKLQITDFQKKQFLSLVNKRKDGWPVAYLTNHKEFFGLDFYVDKNVLIPRPETEGLVELVLDKVKSKKSKVKILDIGTGSGCIIISLAKTISPLIPRRSSLFFASDISPAALMVAKKNARHHGVKITFRQGDLLAPWRGQNFDIIVANLPYLAKEADQSTKFEPKKALIAKKNGLDLLDKLFRQISALSALPSVVSLEIGHDQGLAIKKLANNYLPEYKLALFKDLAGWIRVARLEKKSS